MTLLGNPNDDPDDADWKFRFYAVNRSDEFVYGFDVQKECEDYVRKNNRKKRRKELRLVTYENAMMFSAGLTPNYQEAWSDKWTEPD